MNYGKSKKEAIKIRTAAELHGAIEYFDAMYGIENAELVFPDGLPLLCVVLVQQTREDGSKASQLIVSDEWPRGMRYSPGFKLYNVANSQD